MNSALRCILELTPNNVRIICSLYFPYIVFQRLFRSGFNNYFRGIHPSQKKIIIVDIDTKQNSKSVTYMTVDIKSLTDLCYNHDSISILYRHQTNSTKCNILNQAKRLTEYIYNGDSISIQYRWYCRYRHQDSE